MTLTSDICGETLRVDDLIARPLHFADGHVAVPQGPGLGYEPDKAVMEQFRVS